MFLPFKKHILGIFFCGDFKVPRFTYRYYTTLGDSNEGVKISDERCGREGRLIDLKKSEMR